MKKALLSVFVFLVFASLGHATTVLYTQNFENPDLAAFNAYSGYDGSYNTVNEIYKDQPYGFTFAQQYTVETYRVGGNLAWNGAGFVDPQGIAGNYVVGMLSDANPDLLGLSFNVGLYQFLNFKLDISSMDLNFWGGPFVPSGGMAPKFRISLYDNPSGAVGLTGNGVLLAYSDITGVISPAPNIFNWTNHIVALDATGNTNGNVTLLIDLLEGGYAAMDNFQIAASDIQGDVGPQVPEPASLVMMGIIFSIFAFLYCKK